MDAMVDFRPLKRKVGRLYPVGHPLREALGRAPDYMERSEYLHKAEVWLGLAFIKAG